MLIIDSKSSILLHLVCILSSRFAHDARSQEHKIQIKCGLEIWTYFYYVGKTCQKVVLKQGKLYRRPDSRTKKNEHKEDCE